MLRQTLLESYDAAVLHHSIIKRYLVIGCILGCLVIAVQPLLSCIGHMRIDFGCYYEGGAFLYGSGFHVDDKAQQYFGRNLSAGRIRQFKVRIAPSKWSG